MTFSHDFLDEVRSVVELISRDAIEKSASLLATVRKNGGRLFILGVGGSAGSASHAVNDFRKLCGFEAYTPVDNVSELTARVNDEGWDTVFVEWLRGSKIRKEDGVLALSVGGGDLELNVSANLVKALEAAKRAGATVVGIVGRDGGYTARVADSCILIPVVNKEHITPLTEAFHGVIWHLLVTHPLLKLNPTKWESVVK
jgi:D-sedoheptulose 7-phosphate isomerase